MMTERAYPRWIDDRTQVDWHRREIVRQHLEIGEDVPVTCPCGRTLSIRSVFRCRECGVWLCSACADRHFGFEVDGRGRVMRAAP